MITADDNIAHAPLPTPETLADRTSLPKQMVRFAAVNLKMVKIIIKGHS